MKRSLFRLSHIHSLISYSLAHFAFRTTGKGWNAFGDIESILKGTTPKKDTKSIYVVYLWNFGQFFPDVLVTHSAEWTGKNMFIFYRPKKMYCDCKIEQFQCHYNKKESLLTLKIKLYKPKTVW